MVTPKAAAVAIVGEQGQGRADLELLRVRCGKVRESASSQPDLILSSAACTAAFLLLPAGSDFDAERQRVGQVGAAFRTAFALLAEDHSQSPGARRFGFSKDAGEVGLCCYPAGTNLTERALDLFGHLAAVEQPSQRLAWAGGPEAAQQLLRALPPVAGAEAGAAESLQLCGSLADLCACSAADLVDMTELEPARAEAVVRFLRLPPG